MTSENNGRLLIARHAETTENRYKYNGFYSDPRQYDARTAHNISKNVVDLTSSGIQQAKKLGAYVTTCTKNRPLWVFTSNYFRSIRTYDFSGLIHSSDRTVHSPLVDEQFYGDATYMTKDELFRTYPDHILPRQTNKQYWIPPGGGESLYSIYRGRVPEFTNTSLPEDPTVTSLVITHLSIMIAFRACLERRSLEDVVKETRLKKIQNCEILEYAYADDSYQSWELLNRITSDEQ